MTKQQITNKAQTISTKYGILAIVLGSFLLAGWLIQNNNIDLTVKPEVLGFAVVLIGVSVVVSLHKLIR